MVDEIRFYHPGNDFGYMSNYSTHEITIDDLVWPTSEHYYQAQKFADTDPGYMEKIRAADTPDEAKRLASRNTNIFPGWDALQPDGDQYRDDIMRLAVLAKFVQHENLSGKLLRTGYASLVEDSKRDFYWGRGADGSGQNRLGRILMEVRGVLRDQATWDEEHETSKPGSAYLTKVTEVPSVDDSPILRYYNGCMARIDKAREGYRADQTRTG